MLADLNEEMKFANFQLRTVKFPVRALPPQWSPCGTVATAFVY